jgi:hypothetical protein
VFSINNVTAAFTSGESDWEQRIVELGAGPQLLDWTYAKDDGTSQGNDRAWVDQFHFTADGAEPELLDEPLGAISPNIAVSGNLMRLTWSAAPNRTYKILYKDDLSDLEWMPLDSEVLPTSRNVDGAPETESYTAFVEDALTSRTRFYRVFEY